MTSNDEVSQASQRFHSALNSMLNGDATPLADAWPHSSTVSTMHPVGGRQLGWDEVWATWVEVARVSSEGKVNLADQIIQIAGDTAYELGVKRGSFKLAAQTVDIKGRMTNIYRREATGSLFTIARTSSTRC